MEARPRSGRGPAVAEAEAEMTDAEMTDAESDELTEWPRSRLDLLSRYDQEYFLLL